jgi:hypothetical protein
MAPEWMIASAPALVHNLDQGVGVGETRPFASATPSARIAMWLSRARRIPRRRRNQSDAITFERAPAARRAGVGGCTLDRQEDMMAKYGKKAQAKVKKVMHERKTGKLRSGSSGRKVKSRKQAIAIGLSEARREGDKVPPRKSAKKTAKKRATKTAKKSAKKSTRKKSAPKKRATKKSAAKKSSK